MNGSLMQIVLQSPRYYSVTDTPNRPRTAQEQYSYSYSSKSATARDSNNPYGRPETSSQSTTVQRSSATGPYGHNYTTERSSTTGSRPGDYSYTSTARFGNHSTPIQYSILFFNSIWIYLLNTVSSFDWLFPMRQNTKQRTIAGWYIVQILTLPCVKMISIEWRARKVRQGMAEIA